MIRKKPSILTIIVFLAISANTAKANLPVIDISSIAQSILQYTQMIKEFTRYEAELRALGIDTGRVGSILQGLDDIGRDITSGIDTLNKETNEFAKMFERINTNCAFLAKSDTFKESMNNQIEQRYKDNNKKEAETLACIDMINNPIVMIETKDEFRLKANEALKNKDYKAYKEASDDLRRIELAQEYSKKQITDERLQKWGEFYRQFEGVQGDPKSPYNVRTIRTNVKNVIEKAGKAQNPNEVTNTTNALLTQMLQLAMVQYDMATNSNNLIIEFLSKEQNKNKEMASKRSETFIDEQKETMSKVFESKAFSPFQDEVQYNEVGLPIMFE